MFSIFLYLMSKSVSSFVLRYYLIYLIDSFSLCWSDYVFSLVCLLVGSSNCP